MLYYNNGKIYAYKIKELNKFHRDGNKKFTKKMLNNFRIYSNNKPQKINFNKVINLKVSLTIKAYSIHKNH